MAFPFSKTPSCLEKKTMDILERRKAQLLEQKRHVAERRREVEQRINALSGYQRTVKKQVDYYNKLIERLESEQDKFMRMQKRAQQKEGSQRDNAIYERKRLTKLGRHRERGLMNPLDIELKFRTIDYLGLKKGPKLKIPPELLEMDEEDEKCENVFASKDEDRIFRGKPPLGPLFTELIEHRLWENLIINPDVYYKEAKYSDDAESRWAVLDILESRTDISKVAWTLDGFWVLNDDNQWEPYSFTTQEAQRRKGLSMDRSAGFIDVVSDTRKYWWFRHNFRSEDKPSCQKIYYSLTGKTISYLDEGDLDDSVFRTVKMAISKAPQLYDALEEFLEQEGAFGGESEEESEEESEAEEGEEEEEEGESEEEEESGKLVSTEDDFIEDDEMDPEGLQKLISQIKTRGTRFI